MDETTNNPDQIIVVAAVISDKDGKLLLLKRKDDEKRAPGKLELPGGRVPFGEEPLSALRDMVREQTQLDVLVGKLIDSKSFVSERSNKHILIFYNLAEVAEIDAGFEATVSKKHEKLEFIKTQELQQKDVESNLASVLPSINSHLENTTGINKIDTAGTTSDEIFMYSDGGSRGNPGPSASGFVILNTDQEVLEEGGEYLGITTNNQAEYHAVRLGLEAARKFQPKKVSCRIDSLLVVNQMNGIYKIKNKDLWPIHEAIKKLVDEFPEVEFKHVPREENEMADAKVNEVLDSRKDLD